MIWKQCILSQTSRNNASRLHWRKCLTLRCGGVSNLMRHDGRCSCVSLQQNQVQSEEVTQAGGCCRRTVATESIYYSAQTSESSLQWRLKGEAVSSGCSCLDLPDVFLLLLQFFYMPQRLCNSWREPPAPFWCLCCVNMRGRRPLVINGVSVLILGPGPK